MNTASFSFGVIVVCSVSTLSLSKPFPGEEKNFGDEKLRCMDSVESTDYDKNNQNPFTDFYNKPGQMRFDASDKSYLGKPFDYNEKRSAEDAAALKKRQVGVVYKDEKPIGILQPFQRSYRFIPVNDENSFDLGEHQNLPYSAPVAKRETNSMTDRESLQTLDESYPKILANFKIGSKLNKKRNFDALTDENVRDLKSTIRRLRSSNSHNTEQIEEELKGILNDMGLIDDEELHPGKREAIGDPKVEKDESLLGDDPKSINERNRRDESDSTNVETSNDLLSPEVKKREIKADNENLKRDVPQNSKTENRQKRQKPSAALDQVQSGENLKDSVPNSDVATRDIDDDDDYEKRVERQIQKKINTLKDEVKREIAALKNKQTDDEDMQRKKRQVAESLVVEENDELNPVKNIDQADLKPLIRRRRSSGNPPLPTPNSTQPHSRRKRDTSAFFDNQKIGRNARSSDRSSNEKRYNVGRDEVEEGENLLGEDEDSAVSKREIDEADQEYDTNREDLDDSLYERNKRSRMLPNSEMYERYLMDSGNEYYDDNDRYKRQNNENGRFQSKVGRKRFASYQAKSRLRRRINEDQAVDNRPQQLSDMSDLDLFGALPKSYSGELSRYKRVRRK